MAGSISSSTAVDLSRLPPPDVVEALDYETILAAMLADLVSRDPSFTALVESDPAMKILEVSAYRELLLRQRINEACRAVMVAYAAGADLDQLGAVFGVTRLEISPAVGDTPAVMEDDTALRRRILLAPDSWSVAGPASAYVFHALSAHADVLDASATSPAPGEVVVSVLGRTSGGTCAPEVLAAVEAVLSADTVRPLTDHVTVQQAELVPLTIQAVLYLYAGPDSTLIQAAATAALEAKIDELHRVGRDVPRSALIAAMHVAGVQRVELILPAEDLVIEDTQASSLDSATFSLAVSGE